MHNWPFRLIAPRTSPWHRLNASDEKWKSPLAPWWRSSRRGNNKI